MIEKRRKLVPNDRRRQMTDDGRGRAGGLEGDLSNAI
jgi:hypothetical protein